MKKQSLVFVGAIALFSTLFAVEPLYNTTPQTPQGAQELFFVEHVEMSIARAEGLQSKLKKAQLAIQGMSSSKVRHFLNNLCSLPECTYLEVGTWKGSTLISALYENKDNLVEATACDNWSEFDGPQREFSRNCDTYLSGYPLAFHDCDSFSVDLTAIVNPVKIYFYDGNHSKEAQEKAFTYYNEILDDVFIAVVDDWNWDCVKEGTFEAFQKLGYRVVFEQVLPARFNQDVENYWNGLYVAVIAKS